MTGGYIGAVASDIIVFGEVRKQFDRKWANIVNGLIFLTIFLPFFILVFLPKSIGDTPRWILFIWFAWSVSGLLTISVFKESSKNIIIIFSFPLAILSRFYIKTIIYFLKKKYPNTDDPNGVHMFNRKLKLKSIL